jgi:protein-disulfide isomerase
MRFINLVLAITLLLLGQSARAEILDSLIDGVFEKKVIEVIMKNPEVIEKTMQNYVEKKRKQQEAEQLAESIKNKVIVSHGESPSLGNKNAKYQLVVFTDFECPYCKKGDDTVQALKAKYGNDLLIVQKNYPLAFHKNAIPAAKAALAAHQQGKFFEYSKLLFQNQKDLGSELYNKTAKDLKLDLNKFNKDMESDKVNKLLAADLEAANKAGVNSTPNFILNGVVIAGAYPIEYFEKIITLLNQSK